MEEFKSGTRRRHDAELKRLVLAECAEAGASIARVALAHGLNANLVHKWRRRAALRVSSRQDSFIPIALPLSQPQSPPAPADVRIELRRGPLCVSVAWPVAAAGECAAWLGELLR